MKDEHLIISKKIHQMPFQLFSPIQVPNVTSWEGQLKNITSRVSSHQCSAFSSRLKQKSFLPTQEKNSINYIWVYESTEQSVGWHWCGPHRRPHTHATHTGSRIRPCDPHSSHSTQRRQTSREAPSSMQMMSLSSASTLNHFIDQLLVSTNILDVGSYQSNHRINWQVGSIKHEPRWHCIPSAKMMFFSAPKKLRCFFGVLIHQIKWVLNLQFFYFIVTFLTVIVNDTWRNS